MRIWFNHWFSTALNIIELMRDNDPGICMIGSNRNKYSVLSTVCDEWYTEPDISGEEYISFCLDFCRRHSVDVFVPRRQMTEITRNAGRFHDIGVKLLADRYDIVSALNDKRRTYEIFAGNASINVPDYYIINDRDGFESAYSALTQKYPGVCMKFVHDEGALSFRRIIPERKLDLKMYVKAEVSVGELCEYFAEHPKTADIMLMPYLSGTEISVDCLRVSDGLIAVPRYKTYGRHEFIRYDKDILDAAELISDIIKLEYPYNIQFRMLDGTPYLLEINTRMSGGIQMSAAACGANIPRIALMKLTGGEYDASYEKRECTVSYIERPLILGEGI